MLRADVPLLPPGIHHQYEVELHWSDPAHLRQRGDGEAVGWSGLALRLGLWVRLALSAKPETPVSGEWCGLVQPGRTWPQAPQHVCHVGSLQARLDYSRLGCSLI